jgi:hypothetical protein
MAAVAPSMLALTSAIGASPACAAGTPTLILNPTMGSWSTSFSLTPTGTTTTCSSNATSFLAYIIASSQATSEADILNNSTNLTDATSGTGLIGSLPANKAVPAMSSSFASGGISIQDTVTAAGTYQVGIMCFVGSSFTPTNDFSTTVTINGAGSTSPTWQVGGSSSTPVGTTTTLVASPASPAAHGATESLTATVAQASGSTVPAGTVTFMDGATALGAPVTVDATGKAATTTTLGDGSHSLTAVFTPADSMAFAASTSAAVPYMVNPATTGLGSGSETVTVTIPGGTGGQGQFTLTVPTTGADTLTVSGDGTTASGSLAEVGVSDTRAGSTGWTVSGQASDFSGPAGTTIPGNALGWVPSATATAGTVTPGPTVAPNSPGLGSAAAVLGSSTGDSTATLGAALNLAIPSGQAAGTYNSTLTITAI